MTNLRLAACAAIVSALLSGSAAATDIPGFSVDREMIAALQRGEDPRAVAEKHLHWQFDEARCPHVKAVRQSGTLKQPTEFSLDALCDNGEAFLIMPFGPKGRALGTRCSVGLAELGIVGGCTSWTSPALTAAEERRKEKIRAAAGYRDPGASDLCPAPYRMTERDGCQTTRR